MSGRGAPQNPVAVALDLPERAEILHLAEQLKGEVGMVKLGLEAFVRFGPALASELAETGHRVFLDLKLHDIPRTVGASVRQLVDLGVHVLTIHAEGGAAMIESAVAAAGSAMDIAAVTVLTSLDGSDLETLGVSEDAADRVRRLAGLALDAGAPGVVCSGEEVRALRDLGGFRIVPGIRMESVDDDDQKRVVSPAEAMREGADWIVVGRPIVRADDPVAAARAFATAARTGQGG